MKDLLRPGTSGAGSLLYLNLGFLSRSRGISSYSGGVVGCVMERAGELLYFRPAGRGEDFFVLKALRDRELRLRELWASEAK